MPLDNIASEAAAVKRALNGGGTLLLVGGRSTNFDDTIRQHPRITVWDSTDPATDRKDPPDNTKVIFCTRFIRHTMFHKLQRFAQKRHILMMPGFGGTGEIKEVVNMALAVTPTAPPTAPPLLTSTIVNPSTMFPDPSADTDVDAGAPQRKGAVKAFVAQHANLDAVPTIDEARRLLALAETEGISTTVASLSQILYLLRRERDGLPSVVKAPPPTTKKASAIVGPPASNVTEALRLIDETMTGLVLVREAVIKVQADESHMQATMTALRGFLSTAGGPQ